MKQEKNDGIKEFANQVWITRMSRINAEKRLLRNESLIQGINIYYSCFTMIISILLLVRENKEINFLILGMTIALTVIVLYFKNMRYTERAENIRSIYTEFQKIELTLNNQTTLTQEQFEQLQEKYCDLLKSGENHITFDYYKAVRNSNKGYRRSHWNKKAIIGYYWGVIWRVVLTVIVLVLPFLMGILIVVGKKHGYCI